MSKKTSRKGKKRKRYMYEKETKAFMYRCTRCEHYASGRCKKYDDQMNRMMRGEVPECDGEPYRTKKGKVILIRI